MNSSYFNRLKRQSGVTLLEALVALVVLSLGLLGIAKLNAYLVATAGQSKARMEALALAEQKIEDLRNQLVEAETTSQDYASLVSSLTTDCTFSTAPSAQKDTATGKLASYSRVWCKLGTAMATQVQVLVSWTDTVGTQQSVTLQSVVAWDSPLKSVAFASTDGGAAAQAFAKPPTGRAYVGKGTVAVDGSVTPMTDGLRIQKDPGNPSDNYFRLVDASGNVLLTATGENETFSIISGRVYIDDGMYVTDPVSGYSANGKVATNEIFVSVSDAAYCSKTIASPVAKLPTSGAAKYEYFDYRCYVGAGWYGNVGIVRVDGAQAKERVCVGDPAVSSSETVSNSRKPALMAIRMYRGYKTIATSPSFVYESSGIGINTSTDVYTPQTYTSHDFLLTIINGSATDADCKSQMELVTSPSNPFTGNQGRFYCLSSSCPSPLPNVGTVIVEIAVTGTITLQPASADLTVIPTVSALLIDSGTCTLSTVTVDATTGVGTQPYTCTISLPGWSGATWSADMTVTPSGGTMCGTGASGPGTVTAGSNVIGFADQSVTDITVSQNFAVAVDSTSCDQLQ